MSLDLLGKKKYAYNVNTLYCAYSKHKCIKSYMNIKSHVTKSAQISSYYCDTLLLHQISAANH